MQAIETRFVGPTNFKGSRVVARCDAKRIIVDWDDALNSEDNHKAAAEELRSRLGWKGRLVTGSVQAGYVHVFVERVA